jgi:hypothetical protein
LRKCTDAEISKDMVRGSETLTNKESWISVSNVYSIASILRVLRQSLKISRASNCE